MPFRTDRREKDPAEENDIYRLKKIRYGAFTGVPVCLQNKNGPCPLLAIANALLLRGEIHIHPDLSYVKEEQLIEKLTEYVYTVNKRQLNAATSTKSEEIIINNQANLAEAVSLLPQLKRGIDVNVRYGPSPESFEFTREVACFDVFRTRLVHGWLVDPADASLYQTVGNRSFNQIMDILIMADLKCSPAKKTSSPSLERATGPREVKQEEKESEDSFKDARSRAEEGGTSGVLGTDGGCREDEAFPNVIACSGEAEEGVPDFAGEQIGPELSIPVSRTGETGTGDRREEGSSFVDASRVELNQQRSVSSTVEQTEDIPKEVGVNVGERSESAALQCAEPHDDDGEVEQTEGLPRKNCINEPHGNETVAAKYEECDFKDRESRRETAAGQGEGVSLTKFESPDFENITHGKDISEVEIHQKRTVKEYASGNMQTTDKDGIKQSKAAVVDEKTVSTNMIQGKNGANTERDYKHSVLEKKNAEISEDAAASETFFQESHEHGDKNIHGNIKQSKDEGLGGEARDPIDMTGEKNGPYTETEYQGVDLEKGGAEISEDTSVFGTLALDSSKQEEKNTSRVAQLESPEGVENASCAKDVPNDAEDKESGAVAVGERGARAYLKQSGLGDVKQVGGNQGNGVAKPSTLEVQKDEEKDMNGPQNLPTRRKSESEPILQAAQIQEFLQQYPSQLTYYGLAQLRQCIRPDELCVLFRNNHFSTITRRGNDLYVLVSDLGYLHETDIVWEKLNDLSGNTEFVNGNFVSFSPHSAGSGIAAAPAQPAPSTPPLTGAHFESDEAYAAYLSRFERENLDAAYAQRLQEEEGRVASASANDAELAKRLQAAENNRAQQANTAGQRQHGQAQRGQAQRGQAHRVARPSSRMRRSRAASSGNRSSRTRMSSSAGSGSCSVQ